MQTLPYGLKKPTSGDKGTAFFPALEDNFEQLDGHLHNGSDSPKLPSSSSYGVSLAVPAASWQPSSVAGLYQQNVTLPSTLPYSTSNICFKGNPDGAEYLLQVEKVSETVFTVFCNDVTKSFTAVVTT